MNKIKLQRVLDKLTTPKERALGGFDEFEKAVGDLRGKMQEEIVTATLGEVDASLNKLKKNLNLEPLIEGVRQVETNFKKEIGNWSGKTSELMGMVNRLNSSIAVLTNDSSKQFNRLDSELNNFRQEDKIAKGDNIVSSDNLKGELKQDIDSLKTRLLGLIKAQEDLISKSREELSGSLNKNKVDIDKELDTLGKKIDQLRNSMLSQGGGAMNRQILVNGVDVLNRYTDINLTGDITTENDNTLRRVNIALAGSGAVWGSISGNINNQVDLQNEFALKADISSLGALAFQSVVEVDNVTITGTGTPGDPLVGAFTGAVDSVFSRTGDVIAQTNDYTWAQIDKTLADIADIPLRSHTSLQDIGVYTHPEIDTHIDDLNNPHQTTAAQVGAVPLVGGASIQNNIAFVDAYPTGPGTTPTLSTELIDKAYADALAQGFTFKAAVDAATTGNITLSGTQTIDGYSATVGKRILVKNQSNPVDNGIYDVASGGWTRATDFDEDAEVQQGNAMLVLNGTVNVATQWAVLSNDPIVGTDPILFIQISAPIAYLAGDGLDLTSTTFSLDLAANQGLRIVSTELAIDYDDIAIGIVSNKLGIKAGSVTNAMLAGSIADSKLNQITTASKVSGAAITLLTSVPSGAGILPIANLASGTPTGVKFIRDDGTLQIPAGTGVTGGTSLGGGEAVFVDRTADNLRFKSLKAGTNVTLSSTSTEITINATGGGGGGTVDSVVAGVGISVDSTDPANPIVTNIGSGVSILTITGTINDSNVTFTATEDPTVLVINGALYQKTGGAYTWSYSLGTITLSLPVGTGGQIYGLRSGTTGGGVASVGTTIDGGGSAITPGSKGYITIPYGGTVQSWTILADQSGSIVIDVKKCTYAGFPTTVSIAGSEKPTLSSAQNNRDTSLTSFSTSITEGDIWEFVVDSASTVTRVNLNFKVIKN